MMSLMVSNLPAEERDEGAAQQAGAAGDRGDDAAAVRLAALELADAALGLALALSHLGDARLDVVHAGFQAVQLARDLAQEIVEAVGHRSPLCAGVALGVHEHAA